MAHPEVAFCRDLRRGVTGDDVIAHKRAVSRAFPSLYPWPVKGFSPFYGEYFEKAVKQANARMGLETKIINKASHEALEKRHAKNKPREWAFDAFAIHHAREYCQAHATKETRAQIVEAGFYWYAHRARIAYDQNRPGQMRKPPLIPTEWDCSMFVINCYYAGGAPDPSGLGYSGYGYTGNLWDRGRKIEYENILPGDIILYGFTTNPRPGFPYGSPTHTALYTGLGMVLSMGSYPMSYRDWNYRSVNCIVRFAI